ncbi:3,4-dihydroxy-2-butanone-4-phosphate synthase [Pseudonocardia sp.]|uniref:3,4-dihydroxy-2-butanone-4-phosphate synthase n=1 Tax=Pseudonocardia sp. TaxID=60912 RepID=UPI003D14892F
MTASAVAALGAGRPVVLLDDAGPGPATGVVVAAAAAADPAMMAFVVRASSGVVAVALPGERLDALRLPPQAAGGPGPAFAVSVDLRRGITTGISARDRAATVRAFADPGLRPDDLVRPGHVLPVRARDGGLAERARPAEAALALCDAAGLVPAAVLATLVAPDGEVAGPAAAAGFADEHGLAALTVTELLRHEPTTALRRSVSAALPTRHGRFTAIAFDDGTAEHLVLLRGLPGPGTAVAVHQECLAADVLGSLRCGCAGRLDAALAAVDRAGCGVVVLLRAPARGFGGCTAGRRPPRAPGPPGTADRILADLGVTAPTTLPLPDPLADAG